MKELGLNENELAKHREAIESLCRKHPGKADFARTSYEEILQKVSSEATIRTYLTILISREVETLIRMRDLVEGKRNT